MDNHQWRLSQACTYAFHISIHISITLITYLSHILCLLHVNFFRYIFYVFSISFIYIFFTVLMFLYFTYPILIMFISFHVRILCMYHILSYNLSYTVLYFYLQSYTFHIRYFCMLHMILFMYYIFLCFPYTILFIYLSLLCTCICYHIFSYDIHTLCFSYAFRILCFSYTILFIRFSCTMYFSYIVILYFSSCSCNCLYFHRIAVLCFTYHVIYSVHVISF